MGQIPALTYPASVPSDFKEIGSTLVTVAVASVSFTGISTAYRAFLLRLYIKNVSNGTVGVNVRLNNDSGANYEYENMRYQNAGIQAAASTGLTSFTVAAGIAVKNTTPSSFTVYISKMLAALSGMLHSFGGATDNFDSTYAGLGITGRWANTADLISRIDVIGGGNLDVNTLVRLEGFAP